MKIKNFRVEIILLLTFFIISGCTNYNGVKEEKRSKMNLNIKMKEKKIPIGEPIIIGLMFRNFDNHNISLVTSYNSLPKCKLTFDIRSSDGKLVKEIIPFSGKRGGVKKRDLMLIEASKIFEDKIEISKWYILDKTDQYTIYAIYENYENKNLMFIKNIWMGRIKSNSLTFELFKKN